MEHIMNPIVRAVVHNATGSLLLMVEAAAVIIALGSHSPVAIFASILLGAFLPVFFLRIPPSRAAKTDAQQGVPLNPTI
jgi:hypothetical protein